jgi:hypothetical protein
MLPHSSSGRGLLLAFLLAALLLAPRPAYGADRTAQAHTPVATAPQVAG